jgi:biotin transport system ATP-binding protein
MSLLEVRRLSHRFPDGTFGLHDISFSIDPGELVLLAGRNGSGKTLLMKHLNGLITPTSGEILLEGKPIHKDLLTARQTIGLVFQDPDNQIVGQTVYDDIAFGPENLRLPAPEVERRVRSSMESLGLSELSDQPARQLSGGEKRRLAIADVLAMSARIIIMDEPFSELDYPAVKRLLSEIIRLHEGGHTLVVITHEVEKILAHATRLVIMEEGRIAADGPPETLLDRLEAHGIRPPLLDGRGAAGVTWLNS